MQSPRRPSRALARLAAVIVLGAPAAARAEPSTGGPFLAASVGGGDVGDAPPGLAGADLDLRGHLELGYGDGRLWSAALSLGLARAGYANQQMPPEGILPDADLRLRRIGFGAAVEGHLPLGRVTPVIGAVASVDRLSASASGALLGVRGEYFETTDVAPGFELRAGADVRVHPAIQLGLRAGWSWTHADLDGLTDGGRWLDGPGVELRVTIDASGFRMSDPAP
jgi:hypothetical protein